MEFAHFIAQAFMLLEITLVVIIVLLSVFWKLLDDIKGILKENKKDQEDFNEELLSKLDNIERTLEELKK